MTDNTRYKPMKSKQPATAFPTIWSNLRQQRRQKMKNALQRAAKTTNKGTNTLEQSAVKLLPNLLYEKF